MSINLNRVVVTGNLTRDPELRTTPDGAAICRLRIAANGRRRDDAGAWVDRPNFFDVAIWGAQAESCAEYLSRGRPVAIDGRLAWREWEASDGSGRRQAVEIVADQVQFLGRGRGSDEVERTPDGSTGAQGHEEAGAPLDDGDELPF